METSIEVGQADQPARDSDWVIPLAFVTAVTVVLARPSALALSYVTLALTAGAAACIVWLLVWLFRSMLRGKDAPVAALLAIVAENRSRLISAVIGIVLTALLMSAFSALKADFPKLVPYYLDAPLADLDHWLFGSDAWAWSDTWLSSTFPVINVIYGAWLPVQVVAVTVLLMARRSHLKTQAIIAYAVMWLGLGIGLAACLSSAGPIFYDRLYGGDRFAGLALYVHGTFTPDAADYLWRQYVTGVRAVGSGISAMPSLHVAGSVWLLLIARRLSPQFAAVAWVYFAAIWLGSVMLGWHYASDGLVGAVGAVFCWQIAAKLKRWRSWPGAISPNAPKSSPASPGMNGSSAVAD